ncbi:hypothetical protein [Liquorilactobacillus capillatus]|uniref:Uncharacterized protein n=1 Tax=Liquorilactobacillus capillatus DSM 19910 TaxID=1423731 RepID=A0A0R1M5B8_9LACO|nr:hypothetical protein [Liquorilactobacillus capillatus]KRL03296.1 hypothetical protein FC81_GL000020 [Liquorilactobacillus capillatus DSM 19910]
MEFTEEESRKDQELTRLLEDVKEDVTAVYNYSTVTINGKYVPNSKLAVMAAKNLLRVSELLEFFDNLED